MNKIVKIIFVFAVCLLITGLLDAQPSITWQREYIGPDKVEGNCITQTFDEGYVMSGGSPQNRYFVIRTNVYGDTIWTKIYQDGHPYKIIQTCDSNFIIAGQSEGQYDIYSDGFIQKIESNGNQIWKKKFGGILGDAITDILELNDTKILCIGSSTFSFFPLLAKYFLLKTESNGDSIWLKYYDSTFVNQSGKFDSYKNDRILISGSRPLVTDTNGTLIRYSYGIPGGKGIADTVSHTFFFVRTTNDSTGKSIIQMTRTDTAFKVLFTKNISMPLRYLYVNDIINYNSGFVICGSFETNIEFQIGGLLIQFNTEGNINWYKEYLIKNRPSLFVSLNNCSDKGYISIGSINPSSFGVNNIIATKTDSLGNTTLINIQMISNSVSGDFKLYQNFPNPFNSQTIIKFELKHYSKVNFIVQDILGKIVDIPLNDNLNSGIYNIIYKPKFDLSSGIYFYTINILNEFEKMRLTKKFALIK